MEHDEPAQIPEHLLGTFSMLKCAFPNGVGSEDYMPLLGALKGGLNDRGMAIAISALTDKGYMETYNDVISSQTSDIPNPDAVARVKLKLLPCGYEAWILENQISSS
jgi:hypothetical protein